MKTNGGKINGEVVDITPEAATLRKLIRDVHSALKSIVIRTLRSTRLPESWQGPAELISVTSTCPTYEIDKMPNGDCFSFSIPYSNTSLKVDVLLCARSLSQLPDIISEDERFFEGDRGSFVNIKKYLPALCDWTPNNSESLASILEQLVIWYQKIQVSFLPSTTRMEMEYETLVDTLDISRDAIQVFCARKIDEDSCILVRLDVDVPFIVTLCEDMNTRFYVLFKFLSFDKLGDVTIKMPAFISNLFDQHLEDLIPSYEPTTLCVDIFFSVKESLQKQLDGIAAELQRNRELLCTVTASSEVLQTDKPLFQSIMFSYLFGSQHYVVKLQLPLGKYKANLSYKVFSFSKGEIMPHAENGSLSNTQISDRDAFFVSLNISENMKASEIWGKVVSVLHTHKV